jgi:Cyclin-dependent kinase inhibitor 3 (CDKN3)
MRRARRIRLEIAVIEAFQITTVSAAPGRIGICRLPGRSGDLPGDLTIIRAWRPAFVVSMTEASEMRAHGGGNLPALLESAGIAWRHFPVVDFGAPEAEVLPQWAALAKELHMALEAGAGVLLHCRGGLGRSGMVALRLLAERGEEAEAALARIRKARPGAVETEGQRVWGSDSFSP